MKRVTLPCAGLVTDPSPHMTYSGGAMRQADDVIVCAEGVAQVRPGFPVSASKSTSYTPRALRYFGTEPIAVSFDGASTWRIESTSATYTGNATPPDYNVSPTQFMEARRSLYHTTSTGIRKLAAVADSSTDAAGVEMQSATFSGTAFGGAGPFNGAASWAYRFVYKRTDANGYVRRSAPSAAWFGSDTAANESIDWDVNGGRFYFPSWLVSGDEVEFYRTKLTTSLTADPGTEYFLAFTYKLTSTDVSNGYFNPPDDQTDNDSLGAALYTNPSQQGIVGAKFPPPIAISTAFFQRCAWYGNTTDRHRLHLTLIDAGSNGTTATGIQFRTITGDFTSGANTILNVSSTTGLVVGMYVTDAAAGPTAAGTRIPANTTITNIAGTTVTMSANATGTSVGASFTAGDIVTVDGTQFYAFSLTTIPGVATVPRCFIVDDDAVQATRLATTAKYLEFAVNYHALTSGGSFTVRVTATGFDSTAFGSTGGSGELYFERTRFGLSSFTISSTRNDAWTPTTSATSTADNKPNRLYWSEPDEPEAVPLGNYVDIGTEGEDILALVPLRTAMLVFKTDGVFAVSGTPPDGWSVDLLDRSPRLVRGGCVDVINNQAVAWTTDGVIAVSEVGTRSLTDGVISREFGAHSYSMASDPTTAGAFVTAWRAANSVLVGVPDAAGDTATVALYCYSFTTGAWSKWTIATYCAATSSALRAFTYARSGYWELRSNNTGVEPAGTLGRDNAYSLSAWTYTADSTTVTVTTVVAGNWSPRVGDFVACTIGGTVYARRLTAVGVGGGNWTLTIASAFPAGVQSNRYGIESVLPELQWQAHSADPITTALYREVQFLLDFSDVTDTSFLSEQRFLLGAQAGRNPDNSFTDEWTATVEDPEGPTRIARHGISRQVARAAHVLPVLQCGGAIGVAWRCHGVGLVFEPVSERTTR